MLRRCRFCKYIHWIWVKTTDIGTITDGHWDDSTMDFFFYKETILTKRKSQCISLIFAQNLRSLNLLNSIHVSFHVLVWSVNIAYVVPAVAGFIIFTRPLISVGKLSWQHFPKFDNKILRKGVKYVQSVFIVDFEHI